MSNLTKQHYDNEKKIVLGDFPYAMAIELSAYCNLKCIMCANESMKRKKGHMESELAKNILSQCVKHPNTKIYFNGYGEPLLNTEVYDCISYATQVGVTNTYMNTNAMLLTEENARKLIEAGLHCLIVSIDGYKKETYESIRVGGDRDTVYKNVTRYMELLKMIGNERQTVEIQWIEMDATNDERDDFINYWKNLGANIKLKPLMTWGGNADIGTKRYEERLACGNCNILQIMYNGTVPVCNCGDLEGEEVIGSVFDNTLEELWKKKVDVFSKYHILHEFDKLPIFCQNCLDWSASIASHI